MWKNRIHSSDFIRNVSTLVAGTAIAQGINFAFNIYLTRIYSPADFGALSVFLSIAACILVFSCGRYDVAMVAAKTNEDASKLFTLSFAILLFLTLLLLPVIASVYFFSIGIYKNNEAYNWLYYIPLFIFLVTGIHLLWMWNVRQKKFKNISFIRVTETITLGLFSIALKSFAGLGLLIASLLSQFCSFIILGFLVFKKDSLSSFFFSSAEIKKAAKDYIEFPKVNILQGFVDMFQINGIPLLMAGYLGSGTIGLYALCMRVLQAPLSLIVKPIATVFFSEASGKHRNNEDLFSLTKKTIFNAALVALPVPLILLLGGPFLFSFVFGDNWNTAGEYAQIFSIWIYFDLVRSSVSQIAAVVGKQKQLLNFSLFGSMIFIATILIGIYFSMEAKNIFILISTTQSFVSIAIIILCASMAKK